MRMEAWWRMVFSGGGICGSGERQKAKERAKDLTQRAWRSEHRGHGDVAELFSACDDLLFT